MRLDVGETVDVTLVNSAGEYYPDPVYPFSATREKRRVKIDTILKSH